MSKLEKRKRRARFETTSVVFSRGARNVAIELFPDRLEVWLKGTRTKYAMPYDTIFMQAMQRALLATRVARMQERKAKKAKKAGVI